MKDLLEFLALYPLWVKLTIAGAFALCVLLLIIFKPEMPPKASGSADHSAIINIDTNSGGQVAGRDIINQAPSGADPRELIQLLKLRADEIQRDLASHFKYTAVQKFLSDFDRLHSLHIAALERRNLIEAHECLIKIHRLSEELQGTEFWARHRAETPGHCYSLSDEAFQRGRLIVGYVGKSATELLVRRLHIALMEEFGNFPGRARSSSAMKVTAPEIYAAISSSDAGGAETA